MKRLFVLIQAVVFCSLSLTARTFGKGPYTVSQLAPGVFHIEDANLSNPAGLHTDAAGKTTGLNNCSDMYFVAGTDKCLLIDLSNQIKWDTSATRSLRWIVDSIASGRKLLITVTHFHGDHTGMLPAFKDDPAVTFWVPREEFIGMDLFPAERTIAFGENASLDLGGSIVIDSFEVPGHSPHSTIFFLRGKDLVFTGDAIGSGNGVWLFSYDSFLAYRESICRLVSYISEPANHIDAGRLIVYGGHYWQKGKMDRLTGQYILDMKILIEKMEKGEIPAEATPYNKYLDSSFRYGTATITWNRADALKYSGSKKNG